MRPAPRARLASDPRAAASLITVACEKHVVVELTATAVRDDLDAVIDTAHRANRTVEPYAITVSGRQLVHILARAASYHAPDRPVTKLQQAMIGEETHQKLHGHVENRSRLCRPDGGSHRHEIVIDKLVAVAFSDKIVAESLRRQI